MRMTRREFTVAIAGAAAASRIAAAQQMQHLTVYFTGLSLFVHDPNKKRMQVGLLGNGHHTIVLARKDAVSAPGRDLVDDEWEHWNPLGLGDREEDVTCWTGTSLGLRFDSSAPLKVSALNLFPLDAMTSQPPNLKVCQSVLDFQSGAFQTIDRKHKCDHQSQDWDLVTSLNDSEPVLSGLKISDTVQYECPVTKSGFSMDGKSVEFKSPKPVLWIMQYPVTPTKTNPREIAHCAHYYDVVENYKGQRFYPRRPALSVACQKMVEPDTSYCTPGKTNQ